MRKFVLSILILSFVFLVLGKGQVASPKPEPAHPIVGIVKGVFDNYKRIDSLKIVGVVEILDPKIAESLKKQGFSSNKLKFAYAFLSKGKKNINSIEDIPYFKLSTKLPKFGKIILGKGDEGIWLYMDSMKTCYVLNIPKEMAQRMISNLKAKGFKVKSGTKSFNIKNKKDIEKFYEELRKAIGRGEVKYLGLKSGIHYIAMYNKKKGIKKEDVNEAIIGISAKTNFLDSVVLKNALGKVVLKYKTVYYSTKKLKPSYFSPPSKVSMQKVDPFALMLLIGTMMRGNMKNMPGKMVPPAIPPFQVPKVPQMKMKNK